MKLAAVNRRITSNQREFKNFTWLVFHNKGAGTVTVQMEGSAAITIEPNEQLTVLHGIYAVESIVYNFTYDSATDSNFFAIGTQIKC